MKKYQKKEYNIRNIYKKNEVYRQIYKTLAKNQLNLIKTERFLIVLHYQRQFKVFTKIKMRNRCLITLRGNAVYSMFKLSRLSLQELIQKRCIPGLKIASW
jgi:ribosomal protein S14